MRKREEIEEQSREQSQGETWDWEIKNNTILMLEVLLDIRELLIPNDPTRQIAIITPEMKRQIAQDWIDEKLGLHG